MAALHQGLPITLAKLRDLGRRGRRDGRGRAVVRACGTRLGELIHNARAGPEFRQMFEADFTPRRFATPERAGLLLDNHCFGLRRTDYPCWGGLSQAQRLQLGKAAAQAPDDDDQHQWLYALENILGDPREWKSDLFTVYL